jgi:hypothetical protein
MSGDVHVRFRERLGVQFPRATRPVRLQLPILGSLLLLNNNLTLRERREAGLHA